MTVQEIQYKYANVFSDLKFDEERHMYFLHGDNLPSVSSLIETHYDKVNFTPMKIAIARREGVSPSEIQERWDKIKNDSCTLGTNTHTYAENYTGVEIADTPHKQAAKNFLDTLPSHYEIAIREARMYSRLYKYAGTADLILMDKRNDSLVIADYKTNKDLFKHYNQHMNTPFDELLINPFSKYQLQLSYYQIMLENLGYPVTNRVIVHLKPDETFQIYSTVDYTVPLKNLMQNVA